jgi:hypothetical protein
MERPSGRAKQTNPLPRKIDAKSRTLPVKAEDLRLDRTARQSSLLIPRSERHERMSCHSNM